MEQFLYYTHYTLLLVFGVGISAAFSGIPATKRNLLLLLGLTALCIMSQIGVYAFFGETAVWQWYPVIVHLPIILTMVFVFSRKFANALSAMASAYLCCQIAKWFGLAAFALSGSSRTELLVRIGMLLATAAVILRWFVGKIAKIYSPDHSNSWVFGITPVVYYLFDYSVAIYSSLWEDKHLLVVEFLPFFLCVGHLIFCTVYYREYGLKQEAEDKEQILRITVEQQTKEVEMIRRLRQDLKLLLNSLSTSIEQSDKETARKLISGFSQQVEASSVIHYCGNDTLNYVLSDYAARCREKGIPFKLMIELTEFDVDEILFSSILANALDNALNAQEGLHPHRRSIRLLLKNSSGKILLCVKNTFKEPPLFRDGIPASFREGHSYGVQSILYITEKLGGNGQFTIEDDWFVLRVVV